MKFNLKTVSLGSLAALALVVAPLAVQAVRADDNGGHRGGHLEQLNLSAEQTTQIEAIRANAQSQKDALLTAEQRATLAAGDRRGWRGLDLTEAQRSQMDAIREASKTRIEAVLTPDQQQQLAQMQQEHGNRGNRDRAGQ